MIPIDKILYKIDQKLNKVANTAHQEIPAPDKILSINENQIKLLKRKVSTNNNYGIGLDSFKKRYQDIQHFVVDYEKLPATTETSIVPSASIKISSLKEKFLFPVDIISTCTKGSCKEREIQIETIARHSDISTLIANSFYRPSFEYQLTFATITSDKILVYTDSTFKVDNIYTSYIRYPKNVDVEGYIHFDGQASTNIDCEFPDFLEDELIDLVVEDLALSTENQAAVQASQIRYKNNE